MDTAFIIGNGESRNIFPIEDLKNKGIIPKAKKHNMNKEKACIDNLILDGKLKILNG